MPKLVRFGFNHVLKVKYISLVNLVADAEVVKELFADHFTIYRIINELYRVLPDQPHREEMPRVTAPSPTAWAALSLPTRPPALWSASCVPLLLLLPS